MSTVWRLWDEGKIDSLRQHAHHQMHGGNVVDRNARQSEHPQEGPGNGGGRSSIGVTKHPLGFQEDGLRHEHRSGTKHRRGPRDLRCVVVGQQPNENVSIGRDHGALSCLAGSRAAWRWASARSSAPYGHPDS